MNLPGDRILTETADANTATELIPPALGNYLIQVQPGQFPAVAALSQR